MDFLLFTSKAAGKNLVELYRKGHSFWTSSKNLKSSLNIRSLLLSNTVKLSNPIPFYLNYRAQEYITYRHTLLYIFPKNITYFTKVKKKCFSLKSNSKILGLEKKFQKSTRNELCMTSAASAKRDCTPHTRGRWLHKL
jgi:hypothetical protein